MKGLCERRSLLGRQESQNCQEVLSALRYSPVGLRPSESGLATAEVCNYFDQVVTDLPLALEYSVDLRRTAHNHG